MYQGKTYQDLMLVCSGIAGVWNSHRSKRDDRVWTFLDFHPDHLLLVPPPKPKTGREILQVLATWVPPGEIEWAPGWGLHRI